MYSVVGLQTISWIPIYSQNNWRKIIISLVASGFSKLGLNSQVRLVASHDTCRVDTLWRGGSERRRAEKRSATKAKIYNRQNSFCAKPLLWIVFNLCHGCVGTFLPTNHKSLLSAHSISLFRIDGINLEQLEKQKILTYEYFKNKQAYYLHLPILILNQIALTTSSITIFINFIFAKFINLITDDA